MGNYPLLQGPAVSIDSTNTVVPRIENYVQRVGGNKGDLDGKIYNSNGGAVALVGVEYSQVGPSGPWLPLTVLSGDPGYNFPSPGAPTGTPFNIPVEITDSYTGNVWFKVEISSPLPNTEDVGGPFVFGYINPVPHAPAMLTVPAESRTGDIELVWTAPLAGPTPDYYVLEEATSAAFADAQEIYRGVATTFMAEDRAVGTYYYRVLAGNSYGDSPWLEGNNPCEVVPPGIPTTISVPQESSTGAYRVNWTPVEEADFYELQEDTTNAFTNPKVIYTGPNIVFDVVGKTKGRFYYRVRAGRN